MVSLALIGGLWLSLLYAATVPPASIWTIQVTLGRGARAGLLAAVAIALGQLPWCLLATALLFTNTEAWQALDLWLRGVAACFLLWMVYRHLRAPELARLSGETGEPPGPLFRPTLVRSLLMPWRLPVLMALLVSVSIHWRGPGLGAAAIFSMGAFFGQMLWYAGFILLTVLFGKRVPEPVTVRSLNKLRKLAVTVQLGLAAIILAPLAFPPV